MRGLLLLVVILVSTFVESFVVSLNGFRSRSQTFNRMGDPKPNICKTVRSNLSLNGGGGEITASSNNNLYESYLSALANRPVLTKSITAAIITAIGDLLAQQIQFGKLLSLPRLLSFTLSGFVFVGPSVSLWYKWLFESLQPKIENSKSYSKLTTLLPLLLDQTLGVIWFFPLYFLTFEGAESIFYARPFVLANVRRRIVFDLPSIALMNWKFWPFVNYISFAYVPVHLRVLFSNVFSVLWNVFLCSRMG